MSPRTDGRKTGPHTGLVTMRNPVGLAAITGLCWLAINGCSVEPAATTGMVGAGTGAVPGTGGITVTGGAGRMGADPCASNGGAGGRAGGARGATPSFLNLGTAVQAPPPVTGGTLAVLRDGLTAIAADADRDVVYIIDLTEVMVPKVRATLQLQAGDQPGRVVEDNDGRVHVVLRGSGSLATIDPASGTLTSRRSVCALPRGLAYDQVTKHLFVACSGGELVTFTTTGKTPLRTVNLAKDLRDVVVDGSNLLVTRFRSAEVLVLDVAQMDSGVDAEALKERISPSMFASTAVHRGMAYEPAVAWRTVGMPGGGAAMVHQRGLKGEVARTAGGYGGPVCDTIVHTTVSMVHPGKKPEAGPAIPSFVLPVDIALSSDGAQVALIAAGNGHTPMGMTGQKVFVTRMDDVGRFWDGGCSNDGRHGPASCATPATGTGGRMGAGGALGSGGAAMTDSTITVTSALTEGTGGTTGGIAAGGGGGTSSGSAGGRSGTASTIKTCRDLPQGVEPTAVGFVGSHTVIVQTREPAQLWVFPQPASADVDVATLPDPIAITLSNDLRADLGHAVFHSNSGGGLACASCHPEGHEDGRTWEFQCDGKRRTQDVSGRISGTEPFHWSGDQADFATLVSTVFVGRMSGPVLSADQTAAALSWINSIPARPPLRPASDAQATRGKALFEDRAVGCASCHGGAQLTNNASVPIHADLVSFQVPSLRGLAWRAPYMHDGCAPDLITRFSSATCGGGDSHGKTSQLSDDQLADLVAYLESL